MKKGFLVTGLVVMISLFLVSGMGLAANTIRIGFNIPMTGDIPKVGEGSKYAGELLKERINKAGGLKVGNKNYLLEFVYQDNEAKAESATAVALKLITQDKVLAIIGPQSSKQAIPAGEICDANKTVMISPWSTNPKTTLNRPWVFRACFLDPFQGPVLANFATKELKAKKAAILYDIASDYPKGLAEFFKEAFEKLNGKGSVTSFETFTTKDRDFSAQLTKIIASKADVLFTPQYYDEVPLIVKQAHELGWKKPILGSDSWGSAELMKLCGKDCIGSFFSTHYAAAGAKGATKEFIDQYKAKYKYEPDDVAALTYDSFGLIWQALKSAGKNDRQALRNALARIPQYDGVTGSMQFKEGSGDPIKSAVILKIKDGKFIWFANAKP